MNKLSILMLLLSLVACGKKAEVNLVEASQESYEKYINAKPLPADPNIQLDKFVINNQYPVELALYQDHKFFYNLENLGTGTGTWQYVDGKIKLTTKRKILGQSVTMVYEIQANDNSAENVSLQFTDRWGANALKLVKLNH